MRQTLYLHIGMGKTGTTALQSFFADQALALQAQGICYPKTCQVANAHHLASPHQPPFLGGTGWQFETPNQYVPKLLVQDAATFLMSSELIAWASKEKIAPYCAAIMAHMDLKIVLYLRRQDIIIMAGYNQQIKAGTQRRDIRAVIKNQMSRFDYLAKIKPWEEAIGTENIIIRAYERQQFIEGDLRKDFLVGALGISDLGDFNFVNRPNSNPRYARAAMEYKRFLNCLFEDVEASGAFNKLLLKYSADVSANATEIFTEHDTLDPQTRQQVLDHFAADNAFIARTYMGRADGLLFTDQNIPEHKDVPPVKEDDFLAITNLIHQKEPKLYKKLLNRLNEQAEAEQYTVVQARNFLIRSLGSQESTQL